MQKKTTSLQDPYLDIAQKEQTPITLFLMNGVPIKGTVLSFDNFTVLIKVDNKQNLIYKHAISTIVPSTPLQHKIDDEKL